jgi:predicted nucleic acid-binding protein
VLELLRQFCGTEGHEFWPEDISLRDMLDPGALITHNQVTDAYLLALALHRGGKLASLDQHIPVHSVEGGMTGLELITAN